MNNTPREFDSAYMTLRDILKNWFAILCIAISAALFTYILISASYVPEYTSRCTMIISAKENSTGAFANTSETEKLTNTITAVMNSSILKKKTAEAVGAGSFDGTININIIPKTNLMELSVTSLNPNLSFRLLKSMLEIYPELSKDILGEIVIEVFEEPSFPSFPANPLEYKRTVTISFLLGAFAVTAIIVLISLTSGTVKNEWEATEKIDTKLLTVLYHEATYKNFKAKLMRDKKRILMGVPSVSFGFTETIKKLRTNIIFHQEKNGGKVLFVTSYDKKEGKTTVAANLAVSLTQRKKKVLLISGTNSSTDLLEILDIHPRNSFLATPKEDLFDMVYTKNNDTLSVFINTEDTSNYSKSYRFFSSNKFRTFLEAARNTYDYIIIDGPSAKTDRSSNIETIAKFSEFSIIVTKQNQSKATLINDTIDMLNHFNCDVIGFVFNDVYSSSAVMNFGYGGYFGYSGYYGYGKYNKYTYYGKYGKYGAHNHHRRHDSKR